MSANRTQIYQRELDVAGVILDGFDRHYSLFREISAEAIDRFRNADWLAAEEANSNRIDMYGTRVNETVDLLEKKFSDQPDMTENWPSIKLAFISLLHQHMQPECAETFFNSVACRVLHRRYYDNEHIFWRPSVATDYLRGEEPSLKSYYPGEIGINRALLEIVNSYELNMPWRSIRSDVRNLAKALRDAVGPVVNKANHQLQVLGSLFFRNKGAYIVGREINGTSIQPFVISIMQTPDGEIFIDALVTDQLDILLLFSFSRAYFMVDMEIPAAYVGFLHELMPNKPIHEIYALIGLQKHGKTLMYRELHHHLQFSRDLFRVADGIRGMVMLVFTLSSYPFVFKVIRDRFDPPKTASRTEVREKYRLVKNHDRVGRLADTLEFSNVALPLDRINDELLEHLKRDASMNIEIEDDHIVVKHVYIERRMTPLNEFLSYAEGEPRERAIAEYGQAIKELAGADIFPGDMMLKNFGVTRHGRIVFYDYDEICYLQECNFRKIPPCPDWMDEAAAEPWYSISADDVFPESFEAYFFSSPEDKAIFRESHPELTTAAYWQEQQDLIKKHRRADVYPYPQSTRLHLLNDASKAN